MTAAAAVSAPRQAVLYRMVMPDHLCPFGLKAKDLLERRGYAVEDHPLRDRAETDAFKAQHRVDSTPQVFIDGQRIGGYDDLREHEGLSRQAVDWPYAAITAVLAAAALAAAGLGWRAGTLTPGAWLHDVVALAMILLAVLKLRDLEGFSNGFLGYDLLAQRAPRYAYVYPFVEGLAGLAMLGGVLLLPAALAALFIGTVGAVSVIKAVYVDHRELHCACVGGDSRVPLGAISLGENLTMAGLALWTLLLR